MDWSQSLRLVAPEELLSVTGLVLLLGAAWSKGARDARAVTWLSVLALFVAGVMVAPSLCAGLRGAAASAFDGLYSGDAFAA
ncbi:MAG: NADH-quinone oxidoreductase subunit N, partial [Novosphingobium sp.]